MSQVKKVLEKRQEEYGSALINFSDIGRGWGALLGIDDIPGWQVALMMDFLKSIRCSVNPNHLDSWIDKQGYTQHGLAIAIPNES